MTEQSTRDATAASTERSGSGGEDAPRRWAAHLIPALVIEAIIAWLDAGSPQPNRASDIISGMVAGVTQAITGKPPSCAADVGTLC